MPVHSMQVHTIYDWSKGQGALRKHGARSEPGVARRYDLAKPSLWPDQHIKEPMVRCRCTISRSGPRGKRCWRAQCSQSARGGATAW